MNIQRCILYILKGIIGYIKIYKFQWQCFIGTSLCRMGILVIVTITIIESFRIIIHHKSNSFKIYFLKSILHPFNGFIYLYFYIIFTSFQCFFPLLICILFWIYLIYWIFVDILLTKSRMKKKLMDQNDT